MKKLKIMLALCVAGLAGLYGVNNLFNLQSAHAFVALVFSQQGHELYPAGLIPPLTAPVFSWTALIIIIALELLAAIFALLGAVRMIGAGSNATAFANAKGMAITGAGLGIFVWFGLFAAIGGAGFQMWQTEAGATALEGAFQYSVLCFLALIVLAGHDD